MIKKLAAIYNVFDGEELLIPSMKSIESKVDVFIIMFQTVSNYGEKHDPIKEILKNRHFIRDCQSEIHFQQYEPSKHNGMHNERTKRNLGIEFAKKLECTHFLHIDCDEFFEDFPAAVEEFERSGAEGSVCELYTYFKSPTLRFENVDNYIVPFIHELKHDTKSGTKDYPFYCDPTRTVNCQDVVKLNSKMHHFSYVRRDINRKINNSSAKNNILKSNLLRDYLDPEIKAGSYVEDYRQTLIEVEDIFGLKNIL